MQLAEASKSGKRLKCIECAEVAGVEGFTSLSLLFEDGNSLSFRVNEDTDELLYGKAGEGRRDLRLALPGVERAYGLSLTWSWEMKNHQGYFDAVQLELTDDTMSRNVVLQLKVAASVINVYSVEKLYVCGREEEKGPRSD
jgi:hypothetical protein